MIFDKISPPVTYDNYTWKMWFTKIKYWWLANYHCDGYLTCEYDTYMCRWRWNFQSGIWSRYQIHNLGIIATSDKHIATKVLFTPRCSFSYPSATLSCGFQFRNIDSAAYSCTHPDSRLYAQEIWIVSCVIWFARDSGESRGETSYNIMYYVSV